MKTSDDDPPRVEPQLAGENLPALVARLGEDIVTLLDSKLELLKVEVKEDVVAYMQGSATLVASGVVVALGCALLGMTAAFLIAALLAHTTLSQPIAYAIGTGIVGATLLLGGGLLGKRTTHALGTIDPRPTRSAKELTKDRKWLGT